MQLQVRVIQLILLLLFPYSVQAAHNCTDWVAKTVSIQGKVEIQTSNKTDWKSISNNETFCYGEKIRTARNSRATLVFQNDSRVTLDQNSTLIFSSGEDEQEASWFINFIEGAGFFRSRHPQRLTIETPFINAVHEGTEFLVRVDQQQTEITVFDGRVAANNTLGKIQIEKGYIGIAKQGTAPVIQALTIRPEDAVQWTLYYPPVMDNQSFAGSEGTATFQSAIDAYQQGKLSQALEILENTAPDKTNANYLLFKASLLLTVGRVDQAQKLIDQTLLMQANNSHAYALQSIIAVAKNRQDKALTLAEKAESLDPQSAVAQIALSYAHQAKFAIDSALKATEEAVKLSPDNALAWARLSELQLSTGERSDALQSAQKAQQLNPRLDRTQTILGFAYLAQVDIDEAKTAFTEAIRLNSADPLAHLGLGLAKIRKGAIEEGTQDLETAVSLDPDNAIMRSYLGKAYYELKNDGFAATELDIAKEMDPNDPTPWFYDAIRKQTTNRPVEALHDMQKAIELNDNRGVYRSKLLLDEDLAARSASLGRIYNDLGFQQLGLVEGWKSLYHDPSNFSAHRLLADNYAELPRHEIARVSELLQSQLLQPINSTPIQPQLVESRLGILDGLGPSNFSTNEFNPLFLGKKLNLQTNIIYGNNDTFGEDIVVSGLFDKFSFNFGQFHYESDGYRVNNDQEQNIYNAFLHLSLTTDTNIQFEYRHQNLKNGDLSLQFDRNKFSKTLKETFKRSTFRVGASHRLSPESTFIISGLHSEFDKESDNTSLDTSTNNEGYLVEAQYIFNIEKFKVILGSGYFRAKNQVTNTFDFSPNPCLILNLAPSCIDQKEPKNIDHDNGYIYSYLSPIKDINLTLGLSINSVENEFGERLQFNPKAGLIWEINKFITLRSAAFRTLKRNLLGDQTIEPTQVAGFNQFFDENNSTASWRYGFALDSKPTKNLATGIELSLRDLDVFFVSNNTNSSKSADWTESLVKSYAYWTPHPWWGLGIEYQFEKFTQTQALTFGTLDLKTHRVPLSLNFFHPSGISSKITATYYNQSGRFIDTIIGGESIYSENSSFWILDLVFGYRLPQRYGKINFGVLNALNKNFDYEERDETNPRFSPEISVFGSLTISY